MVTDVNSRKRSSKREVYSLHIEKYNFAIPIAINIEYTNSGTNKSK